MGWSDVTESIVTTRPLFCGDNIHNGVELGAKIYLLFNKMQSVVLEKISFCMIINLPTKR